MIHGLPKTLRDAVRMYEIDGLSQLEIAERLGISLSGAKSECSAADASLSNHCGVVVSLNLIDVAMSSGARRQRSIAAQASCECNDVNPCLDKEPTVRQEGFAQDDNAVDPIGHSFQC